MDKIQSYKDAVMDLKQQYLNNPGSDIDQKLNEVAMQQEAIREIREGEQE